MGTDDRENTPASARVRGRRATRLLSAGVALAATAGLGITAEAAQAGTSADRAPSGDSSAPAGQHRSHTSAHPAGVSAGTSRHPADATSSGS